MTNTVRRIITLSGICARRAALMVIVICHDIRIAVVALQIETGRHDARRPAMLRHILAALRVVVGVRTVAVAIVASVVIVVR